MNFQHEEPTLNSNRKEHILPIISAMNNLKSISEECLKKYKNNILTCKELEQTETQLEQRLQKLADEHELEFKKYLKLKREAEAMEKEKLNDKINLEFGRICNSPAYNRVKSVEDKKCSGMKQYFHENEDLNKDGI